MQIQRFLLGINFFVVVLKAFYSPTHCFRVFIIIYKKTRIGPPGLQLTRVLSLRAQRALTCCATGVPAYTAGRSKFASSSACLLPRSISQVPRVRPARKTEGPAFLFVSCREAEGTACLGNQGKLETHAVVAEDSRGQSRWQTSPLTSPSVAGVKSPAFENNFSLLPSASV